jgi:hypothetical protein
MGYETNYKLKIHSAEKQECQAQAEEALERDGNLSEFFFGNADSCTWYFHEDDMKALSTNHPRVVFLLEGEGEESGDIWRKFFKNGRMQRENAQIIFGEFNEEKLQ